MKKKHPDIVILKDETGTEVLAGTFCNYAGGPMTDTACAGFCDRYSSCDEAMHNDDLMKLIEGGYGMTWCDVCGDVIPGRSQDDFIRVRVPGKRYKCCSGTCAEKVMKHGN